MFNESFFIVLRYNLSMTVDLFLDEKVFISVKRASKETGYSQDYIGQLSRKGKIPAKLIGRSWFVNTESLRNYKQSVSSGVTNDVYIDSNLVENKADLGLTSVSSLSKNVVYGDLNIPKLIDKDRSRTLLRFGTQKLLVGSAALVAAFVFLGSVYSWSVYVSPNFFDRFDASVVSYYEEVSKLLSGTKGILSRYGLAQVGSVDGGVDDEDVGLVVLPASGDQHEKIDLVKKNFSDDVEIYFDEDEQSGVIRPVFRSSNSSEDYAFVMVPIKEKK